MEFYRAKFKAREKLDLIIAAQKVFKDGKFVGGDEVRQFELNFAKYLNSKNVVSCASGLDALKIAIRVLNLPKGSKIAVSGHTFFATWLAILSEGHFPVGIDVKLSHGQMDANQLEGALSEIKSIRAVIYVHMHGIEGEITEISKLCKKWNLPLIEDCAQAHGLQIEGKKVGTFGVLACFSFYPTKNLGAFGDAGCVIDNQDFDEQIRSIANYGWAKNQRDLHVIEGINSRLDTLQASFLSTRLKKLDALNLRRLEIAEIYLSEIPESANVLTLGRGKNSVWHHFPLLVLDRISFRKFLQKYSIETQVHYPVPSHLQPLVQSQFRHSVENYGPMTQTEYLSNHIVSIPMNPWVTKRDQMRIIEAIRKWADSVN